MKAPEFGLAQGLGGCGKARRPRWTPSDDAKGLLETIFSADAFPTFAVRSKLASQLGIDCRQVQIWFQNRRQRERIKSMMPKSVEENDDAANDWVPGLQVQLPGGKQLLASHSKGKDAPLCPHALSGAANTIELSTEDGDDMAMEQSPCRYEKCGLPSSGVDALTAETCSLSSMPLSPKPRNPHLQAGGELRRSPSTADGDSGSSCMLNCSSPSASIACNTRCAPPSDILGEVMSVAASAAGSKGVSAAQLQADVSPPPALVSILENLPKDASGATAPHCAAPSLARMLSVPGGARALQSAARNVLVSHPLFQHPSTPCHELLTQLANILPHMAAEGRRPGVAVTSTSDAAQRKAPLAPAASILPARAACLSGTSSRMRELSSEALEVLSSQFFSGGVPHLLPDGSPSA